MAILIDIWRRQPASLSLVALATVLFVALGPGGFSVPNGPIVGQIAIAISNVFRHGDLSHLLVNLAVIAWAGRIVEPRLGPARAAAIALAAVVLGTLVETWRVDARFLGLSGVAYAFAVSAVVLRAEESRLPILAVATLAWAAAEVFFLSRNTAVYVHLMGISIGWSAGMFGRSRKSDGPVVERMRPRDIKRVVAIIEETDEDDAEEAAHAFQKYGVDRMLVLKDGGEIVGVTGHSPSEGADDVVWLSWTYLASTARKEGLGRFMVEELLSMLNGQGVRKIFIATSDYAENGEIIYADAHAFYEGLGAVKELVLPDYHAPGEAKIIYGLDNPNHRGAPATIDPAAAGLSVS